MKQPLDIRILGVDDDPAMTELIDIILKESGFKNYKLFNDPYKLLDELTEDVHIVIVDNKLNSDITGLELVKKIAKINKHCCFIMVSGDSHKSEIIDYMNSVYGSKFIEKGSASSLIITLVTHINEIVDHIHYIDAFYETAQRGSQMIEDAFDELINIART